MQAAALIAISEQLSLQQYSYTPMSGCASSVSSAELLSPTAPSFSSIVSQPTSTPASTQTRSPTPSTPSSVVSLQSSFCGRPVQFHTSVESRDSALYWYGPECRSPPESVPDPMEHDRALLDQYIGKNDRLALQINFLKAE
jgi:hypothetical protein